MKRQYKMFLIIVALLSVPAILTFANKIFLSNKEPNINTKLEAQSQSIGKIESIKQDNKENNTEKFQNALLPDLRVEKLVETYIGNLSDKRMLRFSGTFANVGSGPLELIGKPNEESNKIEASQIIYGENGNKSEHYAGSFILHPTHNHWHFENFVSFSLFSVRDDGSVGNEIISTGKVTYCIHDYAPLPDEYPGKPDSIVYPWCTTSFGTQGISVGWVDTYKADVPGQELDISNLPDGVYALQAVADPENRIVEEDENNNTTLDYLEIKGNSVKILDALPG